MVHSEVEGVEAVGLGSQKWVGPGNQGNQL